MGSLLEFLLIRYCKWKKKQPIPSNKHDFYNYLKRAINDDIFGERKRWQIIQFYLRHFRNYIHIENEVKGTNIDKSWYDIVKPAFEVLFNEFIS